MALNRSLQPADYGPLDRYMEFQSSVEDKLQGVAYRKDHQHRYWEYGNVLYQLDYLQVSKNAAILDTGSGASYLPPALKLYGYENVHVSDSMHYGDITDMLIAQCQHLGIELPIIKAPVEDLSPIPSGSYDVTLCISVIEHVAPEYFIKALNELKRVTKIGGYIFITSDFFRNEEQGDLSIFASIQHNRFTPELSLSLPELMNNGVEFVGGVDFTYHGDFVNNYSFVNICLKRIA